MNSYEQHQLINKYKEVVEDLTSVYERIMHLESDLEEERKDCMRLEEEINFLEEDIERLIRGREKCI